MEQLVTLVGQGGAMGVLAIWLYVEQQRSKVREDRIDAIQKANDALRDNFSERTLKALNDVGASLKDMGQANEATRTLIEGINNLVQVIAQDRGHRDS